MLVVVGIRSPHHRSRLPPNVSTEATSTAAAHQETAANKSTIRSSDRPRKMHCAYLVLVLGLGLILSFGLSLSFGSGQSGCCTLPSSLIIIASTHSIISDLCLEDVQCCVRVLNRRGHSGRRQVQDAWGIRRAG